MTCTEGSRTQMSWDHDVKLIPKIGRSNDKVQGAVPTKKEIKKNISNVLWRKKIPGVSLELILVNHIVKIDSLILV